MRIEKSLARLLLGAEPKTKIKWGIFDHDGTLVDSEFAWVEGTRIWLKKYGKEYKPEIRLRLTGKGQTEVVEILKQEYELPGNVETLREERLAIIMELFEKTATPIWPVITFVRFLHRQGFRLAIASGAPIEFLEKSIQKFELADLFEVIVTGDHVCKGKPEPDIFLYTLSKIQEKDPETENSNCLVVEDSYNGAVAAKRAGMKCLLVPRVIILPQIETLKRTVDLITDLKGLDYALIKQELQRAACS
ncbi:HAD family phosphatase [bacterium]|nr:HAD family phosphatase [bacterium]